MSRDDTAVCVTVWRSCKGGIHIIDTARVLDYLYPPRCPVCDGISAEGICPVCRKKVIYIREDYCLKCGKPLTDSRREYCDDCTKHRHEFVQGRSLFSYQGAIRDSLYRLKYSNKREYAAVYGRELAEHLKSWILHRRITKIVPIPLHRSRQRQRGYNQAALLARVVGGNLGIPVDERLLYRCEKTKPQKTLSGQERRKNLEGAFRVKKELCPDECILLVDDIYTTGSTADAAAKCIRKAGKCRVYVLSVAIGG